MKLWVSLSRKKHLNWINITSLYIVFYLTNKILVPTHIDDFYESLHLLSWNMHFKMETKQCWCFNHNASLHLQNECFVLGRSHQVKRCNPRKHWQIREVQWHYIPAILERNMYWSASEPSQSITKISFQYLRFCIWSTIRHWFWFVSFRTTRTL